MNLDLDKLIKEDSEKKRIKHAQKKEGLTVRDYIGFLKKDFLIAQNAHSRAIEVICGPNGEYVEEIPGDDRWLGAKHRYSRIADALFGADRQIAQSMEYMEAGKNRTSTGKKVLLLVGPPGSGKSTFANYVQGCFEKYAARPVYMLSGCPKFEDPLHVIPRYAREEVEKELGVRIDGDLCPVCRHALKEEFTDKDKVVRWWDMPIEEMSFSISGVRGLTTFRPSDEKTSDLTALSGRENISITSQHGYEHPQAYEISGKIPKAERGCCQGEELTSGEDDILGVFFSVAEERKLEIPNSSFPHLSVDTMVIAHTNVTPFKKFASNMDHEGLHRRFFVVPWPFALRIKDELATYKKLIEKESAITELNKCHIAPGALELAATFAVMTRYVASEKVGLLTKAKIYNGERALTELEDADTRPRDIKELLDEGQAEQDIAKREGMFGVSPSDVLLALDTEIVRQSAGKKCLTPLSVIRTLRDTFKGGHRMGYTPEQIEHFMTLISADEDESVMNEYKDYVVTHVSKAFLDAYDDLAHELFKRYISEVSYYRDTQRKFIQDGVSVSRKDPVTGKPKEPDVKFMRSVEKHLNLDEEQAEVFRGEILEFKEMSYDSYRPLAKAVEKKLLEDSRSNLTLVLSTDKPLGAEDKQRVNDLFGTMKKDHGFCEVCAAETVEKARDFLSE